MNDEDDIKLSMRDITILSALANAVKHQRPILEESLLNELSQDAAPIGKLLVDGSKRVKQGEELSVVFDPTNQRLRWLLK